MAGKSHFEMKRGPSFNAELRRLGATQDKIEKVIKEELITTAAFIRNHIIKSMQKTPRITRRKSSGNSNAANPIGNFNWISGGKLHIPSSPGYAPAVDTGDLKKSIRMDVRAHEVEVGSNLKGKKGKYPIFLEFGTKNMEARPFMEPAFIAGERHFFTGIRKHILNAMR